MTMIRPIAHIHTEFPEKFGIPRQSGLVESLRGEIVFEKEYRSAEWFRGLDEYSHIWLIFDFSMSHRTKYSPLVYPPRLGGKEKKGVFATRSPFRPNSMGLSSVKLEEIIWESNEGPMLVVSGADLLDGTPIYDIKPYLPYADCHIEAKGSFGERYSNSEIEVEFPKELQEQLPKDVVWKIQEVLAQDPRAAYNKKPDYVYGMSFQEYDIRFQIKENVLVVLEIINRDAKGYSHIK